MAKEERYTAIGRRKRSVAKVVLTNGTGKITVNDKDVLYHLIKKVSVRASAFQSHSKDASDVDTTPEEDAAEIVHEVKQEMIDDANVQSPDDWGTW